MSDHTDTLTDAERAELAPFQWAFHLGVAEGRSYEAAKALTAVVESIVAARVAAAHANERAAWVAKVGKIVALLDWIATDLVYKAPEQWPSVASRHLRKIDQETRALIEGADK